MVRHTPDFLRQRSSNVALRMAAVQSPRPEAEVDTMLSQARSPTSPASIPTTAGNESEPKKSSDDLVALMMKYSYEGMLIQTKEERETNPQSEHNSETVNEFHRIVAAAPDTKEWWTQVYPDLLMRTYPNVAENMPLADPANGSQVFPKSALEIKPEAYTVPFTRFLQEAPTVFHAVDYFKGKAEKAGYVELPVRESWAGKIVPGGKYYVTRNGSTILGFTVGKAYKPGNGVAMIAGHIDALTSRLKPVSSKTNKAGYLQLGVAPYAGALNETWWDRDLSIGGRVVLRDASGKTSTKLVKLDWPIARIPTLAPHFGVGMLGSQNKETEMVPIIGLDNSDLYPTSESQETKDEAPAPSSSTVKPFTSSQPPKLVKLISNQLGITDHSQIVNWELELFDLQPSTVGGMDKEFIFGGRIDDKLCSWAAFEALLAADAAENDGVVKLVALFDDEEIGSLLRQGARGNFLPSIIERLVEALATKDAPFGPGLVGQTYANSFLASADVTHAINPNFLGRYLEDHAPRLNVGIVLAQDSNGHMTTDSVSTAILHRVAELSGCTPQAFMIRNDSRSGGTVGPMLSSAMGVKAADVGLPQLSMHSIRATTGALDPGLGVKFFKGFLDHWEQVDAEWA